ncbi:MAG: hypothetical protein AAFU56_08190 [Pseudomonadota bacterium]
MRRHLALQLAVCLSALWLGTATALAQNGLSAEDQAALDRIIGNTVLFVNDTDKIPQVEFLSEDGTGWVWTASFRDRVVPTEWAIPGLQDGRAVFCFVFKASDVGLPRDLRLCDYLQKIAAGILDEEAGDVFGLADNAKRGMELPFDIESLEPLVSERVAQ